MSEQPVFNELIADDWVAVQANYDGHDLKLAMEWREYSPEKHEETVTETRTLCFRDITNIDAPPPTEVLAKFNEKPPIPLRGCLFIFLTLLYPFGFRKTKRTLDTARILMTNIASYGSDGYTTIEKVTNGFLVYGGYGNYYIAADEVAWCDETGQTSVGE
jgi:hypothetical protein